MPYASVNNCQLFYQTADQGTPVVYIHGGFASLDTLLRARHRIEWDWEHDFAATFQFISYDRRGCYRSSSPDSGYDLVTQAHDLAALLDHLMIERAHLIGSSAGGPIAMLFAAIHPAPTRSLILVGTAIDLFPLGEPGSDLVRQQLVILERDGAEAAFDHRPAGVEVTFAELWDEPEARARGELDAYRRRQQQWRTQAQNLPKAERVQYYATELRNMQAYMTTTIPAFAAAVNVPTYIMHGSQDQMVPLADAQQLARIIPGAQLQVVAGGSHTLIARSADARRQVTTWIQQVETRSNHSD